MYIQVMDLMNLIFLDCSNKIQNVHDINTYNINKDNIGDMLNTIPKAQHVKENIISTEHCKD